MTIAFPAPDEAILARREEILRGLSRLVPGEALITTEDERRAFETDALTAYRRIPLAVVLPTSTAEVSAVMRFCHDNGVKVVPRGAGTSLAGGAIPQEDAIVLGVAKMNRVIDLDFANRTARVQSGITNLAISQAVAHEGFFYAPDPSSQLACTIAGNIAMNSGGAHCLKYGVTTNNLLGVTMVMLDGTVVEIGGKHLDSAGYDLLGPLEAVTRARETLLERGAVPAGPDAHETVRVWAGVPRFGSDLTPENFPGEAGILGRSVDFGKGCYPGQETVARMRYRGHPNRTLYRVSHEGYSLAPGAPILQGEKTVGTVTSVAPLSVDGVTVALCYLSRNADLHAPLVTGDGRVEVLGEVS